MSKTIQPGLPGVLTLHLEPGAAPRRGPGGSGGFAAALQATGVPGVLGGEAGSGPAAREVLIGAARRLERGQRMVDSVIRAARRGRVFSQEELIAIQAGVYRHSQELELAGKLVDKATGAVRQTLQSQQ